MHRAILKRHLQTYLNVTGSLRVPNTHQRTEIETEIDVAIRVSMVFATALRMIKGIQERGPELRLEALIRHFSSTFSGCLELKRFKLLRQPRSLGPVFEACQDRIGLVSVAHDMSALLRVAIQQRTRFAQRQSTSVFEPAV